MDITAANAVFTLTPQLGSSALSGFLPTIAGVGFQLQGFATNDAFAAAAVQIAETRKGVDGKFSAGYIPYITNQTVTFQADSPSIAILEALINAQKTLRQPVFVDAIILLPAVGKSYAMVNGVLANITPITPAKKVLEEMTFEFHWDDVTASPIQ